MKEYTTLLFLLFLLLFFILARFTSDNDTYTHYYLFSIPCYLDIKNKELVKVII